MVKLASFAFALLLLFTVLASASPTPNGDSPHKDDQKLQKPRKVFYKENLFCETAKTSARLDDIKDAASQLNEWSRKVWQTNKFGSKCSQLTHYMTAKISICNGGKKGWMRSDNARRFAEWIAEHCNKDGKAGGYYEHWDLGMRIVVH